MKQVRKALPLNPFLNSLHATVGFGTLDLGWKLLFTKLPPGEKTSFGARLDFGEFIRGVRGVFWGVFIGVLEEEGVRKENVLRGVCKDGVPGFNPSSFPQSSGDLKCLSLFLIMFWSTARKYIRAL